MKRARRVRAYAGAMALVLWIVIGGAFCNAQSGGPGRPANSNQPDDNDNNTNDNGTVDNGGEDLTAPETLSGTVNVRDFTVPAAHTTRVTSDLVVNASGNVTIDGNLIADASEAAGYSITIDAQGDVDVGGIIQAADAGTATAASGPHAAQEDEGGTASSHRGDGGGSLSLKSARRLTIRNTAMLQTGNGSHGQDGFADSAGGQGGSILLYAGSTISLRGSLFLGHGGNGGMVMTTIDDLPADGFFTNHGGQGGVPIFQAPTLDIPGLRSVRSGIHALDAKAYLASTGNIISGSAGGSAGYVIVIGSMSASAAATRTARLMGAAADDDAPEEEQGGDTEGEDNTPPNCICPEGHRCLRAASGGWGWALGGTGGDISISVTQDRDGFDGTSWAGIAGDGGNVDEELILIPGSVDAVILDNAEGGDGGSADVAAALGALGNDAHPGGGRGGSAYACGGRGGNGCLYGEQTGGNGGDALVYAGDGGGGNISACAPGNGGDGGDGLAYGGYGGHGFTPGVWGGATTYNGQGGTGGHGSPQAGAGAGGRGGRLLAHSGCAGRYDPDDSAAAECGAITDERAADGEPGSQIYCCGCED